MFIKTVNKKVSFEYNIIQEIEAGIVLVGNEVKSIRQNNVDISNAYVIFEKNEPFVIGMHIESYKFSRENKEHNPKKQRKLLLNRNEINRLYGKIQNSKKTIVVSKVYIKNGLIKLTIALVEGKNKQDKREYLKEKAQRREVRNAEL